MIWLALEEAPAFGIAHKHAISKLDFAAQSDGGRRGIDFHAFETVVVVVHMLCAGGNDAFARGIVGYKIRIAADRNRTFAREEAEKLRGFGARGVDEAV